MASSIVPRSAAPVDRWDAWHARSISGSQASYHVCRHAPGHPMDCVPDLNQPGRDARWAVTFAKRLMAEQKPFPPGTIVSIVHHAPSGTIAGVACRFRKTGGHGAGGWVADFCQAPFASSFGAEEHGFRLMKDGSCHFDGFATAHDPKIVYGQSYSIKPPPPPAPPHGVPPHGHAPIHTGPSPHWKRRYFPTPATISGLGALPSREVLTAPVTVSGVSYAEVRPEHKAAVEAQLGAMKATDIDQSEMGRTLVVAKAGGSGVTLSEIIGKERAAGNAVVVHTLTPAQASVAFFGPYWLKEAAATANEMGGYLLYLPKGGWGGGLPFRVTEATMPWFIAGGIVVMAGGVALYRRRKKSP